MWDLPVGKSAPGEPITQTATRELYEETGLIVDEKALRPVHLIHAAWGVEAPNGFLTVVFATHEWSGTLTNAEPAKHSQVCWTDCTALPDHFVPSTAKALRSYLAGGPGVSLHGWEGH